MKLDPFSKRRRESGDTPQELGRGSGPTGTLGFCDMLLDFLNLYSLMRAFGGRRSMIGY